MKILIKTQLLLGFAIIFGLYSCSSEDGNDPAPAVPQYTDQDVQGTVYGNSWSVQTGTVVSLTFDSTSYTHYITLSKEDSLNTCDFTFGGRATPVIRGEQYIVIAIDDLNPQLQSGAYNFFSATSDGNAELSFVDFTGTGSTFTGQTGGTMEITNVDTAARIVEGRVLAEDVNFGSNSSINGNFSATYCLQ